MGTTVDLAVLAMSVTGGSSWPTAYNQAATAAGNWERAQDRAIAKSQKFTAAGLLIGTTLGLGIRKGLAASGAKQATEAGLTSILGDVGKAKKAYADISDFSLISPLTNSSTAKASLGLLASQVATAQNLKSVLHDVGNAVAYSGAPDQDAKFAGITRVLAKIGYRGTVTMGQLNQLSVRNVPAIKILKEELGLTGKEVANIGKQGIKANVAIPALLRGFGKLGGGKSMERINATLPGQLSRLEDAADQAAAAVGDLFNQDATGLVKQVTEAATAFKKFSTEHPKRAKYAVGGLALAAGASIAYGKYVRFNQILKTTAASKAILANATGKDSKAELLKAGVAGKEAAAIRDGSTAVTAATAAKAGLGAETAAATGKLSLLARTAAYLGRGVGPQFSVGGAGLTGLRGATVGSTMLAGATGLASGATTYDNLSALGDKNAGSRALEVGVGAALISAFNPPAALLFLAASALSEGVNEYYNRPLEKAATEGTGGTKAETDSIDAMRKRHDYEGAEKENYRLAQKARDAGDEDKATMFINNAQRDYKNGKIYARDYGTKIVPGTGQTQKQLDQAEANRQVQEQYIKDNPELTGHDPQRMQTGRTGTRYVTLAIPASNGDQYAQAESYRSRTPAIRDR